MKKSVSNNAGQNNADGNSRRRAKSDTKEYYAQNAPTVYDNGYFPTPCKGKVPLLKGWQKKPKEAMKYEKYNGSNVGVLTKNLSVIDIDVTDAKLSKKLKKAAIKHCGSGLERIGQRPKFALVYRPDNPRRKTTLDFRSLETGESHKIEFLGKGQQFIGFGVHPDTGEEFSWPKKSLIKVPRDELTEVTLEQIEAFKNDAIEIMKDAGYSIRHCHINCQMTH